jgi:hypothetical protein
MENVYNETVIYLTAMLKRVEMEMAKSQSARLAMGFLSFDRERFIKELDAVKEILVTTDPVDFPETHPDTYLDLKVV